MQGWEQGSTEGGEAEEGGAGATPYGSKLTDRAPFQPQDAGYK